MKFRGTNCKHLFNRQLIISLFMNFLNGPSAYVIWKFLYFFNGCILSNKNNGQFENPGNPNLNNSLTLNGQKQIMYLSFHLLSGCFVDGRAVQSCRAYWAAVRKLPPPEGPRNAWALLLLFLIKKEATHVNFQPNGQTGNTFLSYSLENMSFIGDLVMVIDPIS